MLKKTEFSGGRLLFQQDEATWLPLPIRRDVRIERGGQETSRASKTPGCQEKAKKLGGATQHGANGGGGQAGGSGGRAVGPAKWQIRGAEHLRKGNGERERGKTRTFPERGRGNGGKGKKKNREDRGAEDVRFKKVVWGTNRGKKGRGVNPAGKTRKRNGRERLNAKKKDGFHIRREEGTEGKDQMTLTPPRKKNKHGFDQKKTATINGGMEIAED